MPANQRNNAQRGNTRNNDRRKERTESAQKHIAYVDAHLSNEVARWPSSRSTTQSLPHRSKAASPRSRLLTRTA